MFATQITNLVYFYELIVKAVAKAGSNALPEDQQKRWITAIAKAVIEIEQNGEFLNYDLGENRLIVWSQNSNQIYSSNGVCQCKAFLAKQPCWHRAAARIYRLYFDFEPTEILSPSVAKKEDGTGASSSYPKHFEMDNAIYIKPQRESTKIGSFRV